MLHANPDSRQPRQSPIQTAPQPEVLVTALMARRQAERGPRNNRLPSAEYAPQCPHAYSSWLNASCVQLNSSMEYSASQGAAAPSRDSYGPARPIKVPITCRLRKDRALRRP
jgi:hypothetical protein